MPMGSHYLFKCHACGYQAEVSGSPTSSVGTNSRSRTVSVSPEPTPTVTPWALRATAELDGIQVYTIDSHYNAQVAAEGVSAEVECPTARGQRFVVAKGGR